MNRVFYPVLDDPLDVDHVQIPREHERDFLVGPVIELGSLAAGAHRRPKAEFLLEHAGGGNRPNHFDPVRKFEVQTGSHGPVHRSKALHDPRLLGLNGEPGRPEREEHEHTHDANGNPPAFEAAQVVPQLLEELLGIISLLHGPSPFCKGLLARALAHVARTDAEKNAARMTNAPRRSRAAALPDREPPG